MCFNLQVYVNFFILVFFYISETLLYLNLNKDTEESRVVSGLLVRML